MRHATNRAKNRAGRVLGLSLIVWLILHVSTALSPAWPDSMPTLTELDQAAQERVQEAYTKLPLSFEANQGQTDAGVKFLSRGSDYTVFLTPTEVVLSLSMADRGLRSAESETQDSKIHNPKSAVLRIKPIGANPMPQVVGLDELPGKSNYVIGSDPKKWRTNVPSYARVKYENVYPGVDMIYYGNQRQLEYDLVAAPGADPNIIRLGFEGADSVEVDGQGDLVVHTPSGQIRQRKPVVYQEADGRRQEIAGSYILLERNTEPIGLTDHASRLTHHIGFQLGPHDTDKPLIIDPVLVYSTYFGGNGDDVGFWAGNNGKTSIAVDSSGNAYVTGSTNSVSFPTQNLSLAIARSGFDIFVTKLSTTGSALVYSTYLGGSGDDTSFGIAVDSKGVAYVAGGTSSTDFPVRNALQPTFGGGIFDAFVFKLDAAGLVLLYSTFLGGSGDDQARGIAIDSSGSIYISGETSSTNFPMQNPLQATFRGGVTDAFVAQFNPAGSELVYSTYLGGNGLDYSISIAVDSSGSVYVTGQTSSTNFPTQSPVQAFNGGGTDAFVTKLAATGSAVVYSTYLGGKGTEWGMSIAVDESGAAYVAGGTNSTNFPTRYAIKPNFFGSLSDISDGFVTKFNATGSAPVYSTYLGGLGVDLAFGVAVDSSGNAYVTGVTGSLDFPKAFPVQSNFGGIGPAGYGDAYVVKLHSTGLYYVYSTYLGGKGDDAGFSIAVDSSGNAYIAGGTSSTTGFRMVNALQPAYGGGDYDAFIAKIAN